MPDKQLDKKLKRSEYARNYTTRMDLGRNPCRKTWYSQESGSAVMGKILTVFNNCNESTEDLKEGWDKYFSSHYADDESLAEAKAKLEQRWTDSGSLISRMQENGTWDLLDADTQLSLGGYHERDHFYLKDREVYTVGQVKEWIRSHPLRRPVSSTSGDTENLETERRVRFATGDDSGTVGQSSAVELDYPCIPGGCGPSVTRR